MLALRSKSRPRAPSARCPGSRGRGGGTTLPGKLLWKLDPGAVDRLAARLAAGSVLDLRDERQDDDGGDGGGDPAAARRLAHNSSGANLVSGVASTLLDVARRRARALRGRRGRAAGGRAAGAARGARCSATSSATSSTATASSSSSPSAGATPSRPLPDAQLVVNGDDPLVGDLARDAAGALVFGLDDPRHARPALQHAADSKYCLAAARRTSTPPPTSATSATTAARTAATRGRRSTSSAREIELHGLDGARSRSSRPSGAARVELALPGLYNVYNALAAAALALALGVPLDEIVAGLERFTAAFGRFERIAVGDRRLLMLLIKNPAGANEAVRTLVDGGAPARRGDRPQRRDRRRPRRLVDLGRRLRAAARRPRPLVASGPRAAELALRFAYGGLDRERIEVVPSLEAALDRGLELTPAGGELVVLPTYTAMLALRRIVAGARSRRELLGARGVKIRVGHLYPDYLNIYADRGNIAVLAERARARGHELEVRAIGHARRRAGRRDRPVLRRRRPGSRAGARRPDLAAKAEPLREAVAGRRRVPRCLRRLPAARTLLPRRRRRSSCRASACCRWTPSRASGA